MISRKAELSGREGGGEGFLLRPPEREQES